jgi:RNase P/RNase MRP subunit POP5
MTEGLATSGGLDMMRDLQAQIVTRRQLMSFGISDVATYRKIKKGEWQRVLPGVCALTTGPLSTEQRRIAAILYAGSLAQLTGLCALHWYGFRHAPTTAHMHVLVPHGTRRRSTGFVIVQRTHEPDPAPHQTPLYRIASPTRAVIDACRASGDIRTTRAIMAEAVQRRFTGLALLEDELRRAGRSRTAMAR